ncbi:hypothetical protein GYMLUDRAFT_253045 [Collybiopsis luxurians FD-317 M1]|uniref:Uncharacterized protein n=1 Tax=Collybiopsis luxurians FD-317 M1 TaxID=944289 RepID=A0A0D0C6M4_9AGAR|nr:hypothetical protein GYMLUDRAFT_253045 [Collybiopsis luxurians FD-317 M1]
MAEYTLDVNVDLTRLKVLKENGYYLCLARKVDNQYNVFTSNTFEVGALVKAQSNKQDIAYKQECVYDKATIMQPAKSDPKGQDGSFKVINEYGDTNFAVAAKVKGEYSVIYNTPNAIKGQVTFTPINEVCIWFALDSKTNTMISTITGDSIIVPYNKVLMHSISYDASGNWILTG